MGNEITKPEDLLRYKDTLQTIMNLPDKNKKTEPICKLRCKCAVEAFTGTVVKEDSENYGKHYFCCPYGTKDGCGFFKWDYVKNRKMAPKIKKSESNLIKKKNSEVCKCERIAILIKCKNEDSKNYQREFYSCKHRSCDYFRWKPEEIEKEELSEEKDLQPPKKKRKTNNSNKK